VSSSATTSLFGRCSSYPAQVVELCAERADVVCWVIWVVRVHKRLGILGVRTHLELCCEFVELGTFL
jgi:hypothetical protein